MTNVQLTAAPILSSIGNDPDLREIVELFVEEMPGRVQTLVDQYDAHDFDGLRRTAHQIKGAAGSYGFAGVTPYAARLENAARGPASMEEIREALDDLVDVCRRLRARE